MNSRNSLDNSIIVSVLKLLINFLSDIFDSNAKSFCGEYCKNRVET